MTKELAEEIQMWMAKYLKDDWEPGIAVMRAHQIFKKLLLVWENEDDTPPALQDP